MKHSDKIAYIVAGIAAVAALLLLVWSEWEGPYNARAGLMRVNVEGHWLPLTPDAPAKTGDHLTLAIEASRADTVIFLRVSNIVAARILATATPRADERSDRVINSQEAFRPVPSARTRIRFLDHVRQYRPSATFYWLLSLSSWLLDAAPDTPSKPPSEGSLPAFASPSSSPPHHPHA